MPANRPDNPLIVQGDRTILAQVDSPQFEAARDCLAGFAELVKSPAHMHTYRLTPLSVWNACTVGATGDEMVQALQELSKYAVPDNVAADIRQWAGRFGRLRLHRRDGKLVLEADEAPLAEEMAAARALEGMIDDRLGPRELAVAPAARGRLKQALVKLGWPVEDLAGYTDGDQVGISLRDQTLRGEPFALRDYQQQAVRAFHAGGALRGGSGVVVLPCGAGKTVVGLGCMQAVGQSTLILTTSTTAVRQWREELLDKTTLTEADIGEYTGQIKQVRPVTVTTYQMLTWRQSREGGFPHLALFDRRRWGLIVYDEVHLLPAPVFQVTADLQARRRLGLTATLIREDGREDDVFALIGPKKADVPWKVLEQDGWIAAADCREIRLPLPEELRTSYAVADQRRKYRLASENPLKGAVVRRILARHAGQPTLLVGMYVNQLRRLGKALGIPVLTGSTPQAKREELFTAFREGRLEALAVSKVANFAVDLPDAAVAVQISGTFGSRQEEAQRLGRILRPKPGENRAHFYTLVTRDTVEQDFALRRQLFLCEQGYRYRIQDVQLPAQSAGRT
ncbi:MAG: DNA repair helicase XPB [Planctomycetota bacterium]